MASPGPGATGRRAAPVLAGAFLILAVAGLEDPCWSAEHAESAADFASAQTPATIEAEVREAFARRDIARLLELSEEAASLPPGSGSKLLDALGATGDLRSGRLSNAFTRMQRLGPVAVVVFTLAVLGSGLLLSALIYLPCAMVAVAAGARRIAIELPRARSAPELDPIVRTPPGTPTEWRSPLGLRAGLALSMADDAFGFVAALACAWWLRAPAEVLAFDVVTRTGALSALVGTAAGNLGVLGVALLLYRWRGVGARGAGLVPLPVTRIAAIATATAVPLLFMSMIHEVAFFHLFGREPRSNVEPILKALLDASASPVVFAGLVLTVAVIAPVAEEIIYRGLLYRAFRDRAGVPVALLLSGFVFAIAHLEQDHLLALWFIGVVLAWVTERSGSLIPAMAAHGLYNGLSLGLYLFTRNH